MLLFELLNETPLSEIRARLLPLKCELSETLFCSPSTFEGTLLFAAEVLVSFIGSPSMLEGEWFVFSTCAAECGNVLGPCPKVIGTGPTVLTPS